MKNRIYFFTGTGNSLWVAKEIANELIECDIVAIKSGMDMVIPKGLERVGFVYPTYGWASPLMVADYFRNAQFPRQGDTYFFAVTTNGGLALNAVPQVNEILAARGIHLNYGAKILMFKNAVVSYNMSKNIGKITEASVKCAKPVIRDVEGLYRQRI